MKWTFADLVVALLTVLNLLACVGYAVQRKWPIALYWLGAAIIGAALLWQARQA